MGPSDQQIAQGILLVVIAVLALVAMAWSIYAARVSDARRDLTDQSSPNPEGNTAMPSSPLISASIRDVPSSGMLVRVQLLGGAHVFLEPQDAAAFANELERAAFDAVHESRARRRAADPDAPLVPCLMPHAEMGECSLPQGHLGVHTNATGVVW